jgi:hypothetical protein
VRQFVEQDYPKPKQEHFLLLPHLYLRVKADYIEQWHGELEENIPQDAWDILCDEKPEAVNRLITALDSFATYLRTVQGTARRR